MRPVRVAGSGFGVPGTTAARGALPLLKQGIRKSGVAGSVTEVRTDLPHVIITYDDGPDTRSTPGILDSLAEQEATATFFVLLSRARGLHGLLAEILAAGHEVGLHGIDHRRLSAMSFRAVRQRTAGGKAELEDLIGEPVRWMRPPYGAQTPSNWLAIRSTGLEPVMWTRTTWDSRDIPLEAMVSRAMSNPRPGTILLAHDGFADGRDGVDDGPQPLVNRPELARRVLQRFAELGFQGRSLRDSLVHGTVKRSTWLTSRTAHD